jgi:hypothetical protein
MADNVTLPGTGAVVATDDVGSAQHQYVKVEFGADGTATKVDASNPLPVTVISSTAITPGTAAANLGKAEDAVHTTGDVGVMMLAVRKDTASSYGADGDYSPVSVTSDGSVRVHVESGGDGSVQGVDAHDAAITADPVLTGARASAAAPTNVSADNDAVELWALRSGALCTQPTASGTLIAAGNGTAATAMRVSLACDGTGVVDTELPAAAALADAASNPTTPTIGSALLSYNGSTWDRTLNGNGTATKALRVTLASDSTGIVAATCTGAAAHGASVSGNPVLNGLEARTAVGTAVTNGQAARTLGDVFGKQVVVLGALFEESIGPTSANFTGTAAADIIAAQASGIKIVVTSILVVNAHATVGTKVTVRDKTTTSRKYVGFAAALGGGFCISNPRGVLISDAASAIEAICTTTGADVDVTCSGYLIKN